MEIFATIAQALTEMTSSAWFFFSHGAWVIFAILVYVMLRKLYMDRINGAFIMSNTPVFLHIKIEKENLQSNLAVEQIFANLHAMHGNFTWAEIHLEGKIQLWISFEIVSLGGKISYIVRTPEKLINLVQSVFYAQYPNAEISQVEDYMKNLEHWDQHHATWDLWGTEFKMTRDYAYPIKTWREFEHPSAEVPILDPLTSMLEALSRAEAHELLAMQIIIRPVADNEWVPHVQEVVKKLKEEPVPHKATWVDRIFPFVNWGSEKTLFEVIAGGEGGHGGHDDKKPDQPKVLRMSEGERNILKAIETKITKPGYQVKIKYLYIAPKDKFDGSKKSAMIGAMRGFGGIVTNNLKPDVSGTWTNYNYKLFKALEKPFVDFVNVERKHLFLKGYVRRSMWIGANPMVMNTEELATLYHFPLATIGTAPVERIDVKKGQPPANLPIMS
ncbi:MAG: hypothetical protein JWO40_548 [Candidatus Doudnabacteria bacterium]|nr:hypothetical protein [Candidatus Doudnabacteria bacterium]